MPTKEGSVDVDIQRQDKENVEAKNAHKWE